MQQPRLLRVPEYVSSAADEAIELAARAGLHLDPWEQLVLVHALGETAAGRWAAFQVGLNVPRQNGKGSVLEARELAGLFLFGERLLIHSAHEQATSSEHFRRLLELIEEAEFSNRLKGRPKFGKGAEAIELKTGQRIMFKTRTGGGGRGFSGDLVVLDEAMILPESFMAALVPTMAARSVDGNPQLWLTGSAVDQENPKHDGLAFSRLRHAALGGVARRAWLEWSADADRPDQLSDDDLADPALWAQANPGLGIRIAPGYIEDERGALSARSFAVERLGVGDWPDPALSDGQVIAPEVWRDRADRESSMVGQPAFCVDVTPDRSFASVAAAGFRSDGRSHGEVVDRRPGTGWVADALVGYAERNQPIAIVLDPSGPAGSLMQELVNRRIDVRPVTAREYAQACGAFFDAVDQDAFRHLNDPDLNAAVHGARKRKLGEAWAWDRVSSDVDISPLVAVTLACWAAGELRTSAYEDRGLIVV